MMKDERDCPPRSKPPSPETTIESRLLACEGRHAKIQLQHTRVTGSNLGRPNPIHRPAYFTPEVDGAFLNTSSITLSWAFYVRSPGRVSVTTWRDLAQSRVRRAVCMGGCRMNRSTTNSGTVLRSQLEGHPRRVRSSMRLGGPSKTGSSHEIFIFIVDPEGVGSISVYELLFSCQDDDRSMKCRE
jgi:hypothetical protein